MPIRATSKNLSELSKEKMVETTKYFQKLRKKSPKKLDLIMQELHDDEFEKSDCLTCANCCKTTSPIFTNKDISRISKHFRMKEIDFITAYLQRDEDDFMVLRQAPCTFLDEADNTCTIYDVRPKACSEYPHTNRKKFVQLTHLTLRNTEVCPAAFNIVENLKKSLTL
ncbi:YkgJ family cysteine cluster protein [Aureibaculum sp. 2210JD6-5]|uniref:YkgJ family cysteine cluster protein n=1 Tax=Aureibaculum sp. 2210JD6-5 TaxID=3103957 RepID=UPI002AAEDE32|nr:YkgJ family cysteine cluster protein [Aureibaculum sp. 2210JD6-5]MDY7396158.1 YkgJ family cysteine cluster protein [Aureibaculum sp. 2210JD6-5]